MEKDATLVKAGYERLFNLGNFDHEKFTITKDVEAGTELVALKKLSVVIVALEEDLKKYRCHRDRRNSIDNSLRYAGLSEQQRAKLQKESFQVDEMIKAFENEHKPVSKGCKCYYCTHVNEVEDIR